MKGITTFALTLCLTAGSTFAAQRYTGKLMDADCYNQNKVSSQDVGHKTYHDITKTCAATASTSTFAVRITGSPFHADVGNTIRLDDAGNALAAQEMQSGALKPDKDGDIHVRVRGKLQGETLSNVSVNPRHGKAVAARS